MITDETIKQIVEKIKEEVSPEKIILFGSYSRGNATKHSDLDLCVVVNEYVKDPDIEWRIKRLFWGWLIPMDIIVYSQKKIDEWKNVKMAFLNHILRHGKVLYEKQ